MHLLASQTEQAPAGQRTGHHARHRLIPASVIKRHAVNEATLQFIRNHHRQQQILATRTDHLGYRHDATQVVRWMAPVDGAMGVIDIEISQRATIHKCSHVRRSSDKTAPNPGALVRADR